MCNHIEEKPEELQPQTSPATLQQTTALEPLSLTDLKSLTKNTQKRADAVRQHNATKRTKWENITQISHGRDKNPLQLEIKTFLSTLSAISEVEPDVTLVIFSIECSLSPGFILSGE